MSQRNVQVVKVGGSLLGRPGLAESLNYWLEQQRGIEQNLVLLIGGGPPVDWLRELHQLQRLSSETAHWAAIEMMDVNALIVADLLGLPIQRGAPESLQRRLLKEPTLIYAAGAELRRQHDADEQALPIGWQVASDSIAAWLAVQLRASLTLLKSAIPAECKAGENIAKPQLESLSQAGYVDEYFPVAAEPVTEIRLATLDTGC